MVKEGCSETQCRSWPFWRVEECLLVWPRLGCRGLLGSSINRHFRSFQQVRRDFVELLRGNYGFTLPFELAPDSCNCIELCGATEQAKPRLPWYMVWPPSGAVLDSFEGQTVRSCLGLARYQVACFALLTLAYTIAWKPSSLRRYEITNMDKRVLQVLSLWANARPTSLMLSMSSLTFFPIVYVKL